MWHKKDALHGTGRSDGEVEEATIEFLRILSVFSIGLLALSVVLLVVNGLKYVLTLGEFGKDGIIFSATLLLISVFMKAIYFVGLRAVSPEEAEVCQACQVEPSVVIGILTTTFVMGVVAWWIFEARDKKKENEEIPPIKSISKNHLS